MKKLFVLVFALTLLIFSSEASPILTEKQAKQLLRSRRQDRPSKPGFPDEPFREYVHHLLALEHPSLRQEPGSSRVKDLLASDPEAAGTQRRSPSI
ncbi:putative protein C17orf67-like [Sigmodon hispidus]